MAKFFNSRAAVFIDVDNTLILWTPKGPPEYPNSSFSEVLACIRVWPTNLCKRIHSVMASWNPPMKVITILITQYAPSIPATTLLATLKERTSPSFS